MFDVKCVDSRCYSFCFMCVTGQQSASNMKARISPASSGEFASDQQFVVLCTEKQARVINDYNYKLVMAEVFS